MRHKAFTHALGFLVMFTICAPVIAQSDSRPNDSPQTSLSSQVGKAKEEVIKAANEYKAGLEKLLVFQEADVKSAAEVIERQKAMRAQNIISERELEDSERALASALAKVVDTKKQMRESDDLIAEVRAAERLASMPRSSVGQARKDASSSSNIKKAPAKKNMRGRKGKPLCKGCLDI